MGVTGSVQRIESENCGAEREVLESIRLQQERERARKGLPPMNGTINAARAQPYFNQLVSALTLCVDRTTSFVLMMYPLMQGPDQAMGHRDI